MTTYAKDSIKARSNDNKRRATMAGVFRMPDEMWERIEPLIPAHINTHRFGGGRP
ncbi:MAG: hypothetical protein WAO61_05920 [Solirubrobacterales bacterium]